MDDKRTKKRRSNRKSRIIVVDHERDNAARERRLEIVRPLPYVCTYTPPEHTPEVKFAAQEIRKYAKRCDFEVPDPKNRYYIEEPRMCTVFTVTVFLILLVMVIIGTAVSCLWILDKVQHLIRG